MPTLIAEATQIEAAGNKPKIIRELIGRVNTKDPTVSVAHMQSPPEWEEPGQRPQFRELTVVLKGRLHVRHAQGELEVGPGQAVIAEPGEWVQYHTPGAEGAEYLAICLPAFSPESVNRDNS